MANTLKFGNENWATKKDSILAYNDENANFKPLPFTTSRASTATRVNKAGLLETVGVGIPRVDYLGNTKGAYLLEPQSTNLIAKSEAFGNSYWTKSGASIEGDASTAGSDVLSGFNFTNWSTIGGASIVDSDTFNSTSSGGIRKDGLITSGKTYLITIAGTTDATSFTVRNYGLGTTYKTITSGAFNETFYIEAVDAGFYLRNNGAYTTNVTTLSVKEVSGFSSPSADSPLGAFKLVESSANSVHTIRAQETTISGVAYTFSLLAKADGRDFIKMRLENAGVGSGQANVWFDVKNGVVGTIGSGTAKIELISNGWYRCSITGTTSGTSYLSRVYLSDADGSDSYTGDGTSGIYLWGAQLEQQSYPTSYIPTSGSAITKLAESGSQTIPNGVINSSEGVLFVEISSLVGADNYRQITLSNGILSDYVLLGFRNNTGNIYYQVVVNSVVQAGFISSQSSINTFSKIAVKWKVNDFAIWVNGIELSSDTSGNSFVANTLNVLNFNIIGVNNFFGNVKDLRVYNTADLTDLELETLTKV